MKILCLTTRGNQIYKENKEERQKCGAKDIERGAYLSLCGIIKIYNENSDRKIPEEGIPVLASAVYSKL
jgi:hypothetical protein